MGAIGSLSGRTVLGHDGVRAAGGACVGAAGGQLVGAPLRHEPGGGGVVGAGEDGSQCQSSFKKSSSAALNGSTASRLTT